VLNENSVMEMIDSLVLILAEPIARNYYVWPVIDKYVFQQYWPYHVTNYEDEIDYFKSWLSQRIDWVDDHIGSLYYPVTVYPSGVEVQQTDESFASLHVYPNPFESEFKLNIYIPDNGNLKIQIVNINGQVVDIFFDSYMREGSYQLRWTDEANLPTGLYMLEASMDDKFLGHVKLVKTK